MNTLLCFHVRSQQNLWNKGNIKCIFSLSTSFHVWLSDLEHQKETKTLSLSLILNTYV